MSGSIHGTNHPHKEQWILPGSHMFGIKTIPGTPALNVVILMPLAMGIGF